MNINDIVEKIETPKDIWKAIFNKQKELIEKYKDIEQMGDLFETRDTNINTANGQKYIKDFAWRVTEELAEADEARTHPEHHREELIDALHFLVELSIIAGYDTFAPEFDSKSVKVSWDVVYPLGLMCNTLKNKPWKQTEMLTDEKLFTKYLKLVWDNMYTLLLQNMDHSVIEIYNYYFKKNKINQFRQRSKY